MLRLTLLLALLSSAIVFFAQPPACRLNRVVDQAASHSFFSQPHQWQEDAASRDEHHAYWKHADGRVMIENSQKPIHFKRNNQWERIDTRCLPTDDGWQASEQPHPLKVLNDASFVLDYNQSSQITFGKRCRLNQADFHLQTSAISEHDFVAVEQNGAISKSMRAAENSIKYSYLFTESPHSEEVFSTITESIDFSSPAHVETFAREGHFEANQWIGPIHFFDEHDNHLLTIMPLICFDAAETWEPNSTRVEAGYSWTIDGTHVQLSSHIPNAWMNSAERQYPITIDPLIIGPTSTFGDNVMLSCFIPEYNVDSLQVTIPAQVTISGCFVTASFWAEPLALATMMDGSMFFSTNCDTSEAFEVDPPTGLQSGTAYLELFDFHNPLLCCFSPSCSEQSFSFRMHLGRYTPEGDCNYSYIFYNPTTTLWPFTAYIEGRTVETYGLEFTVANTPICSSQCTFEGKVRTKYGVPPYTITHPWIDADSVVAVSEPCDLSGTLTYLYMQWPECPQFCPEPFSIDVPAPTVVDACGNVVSGLDDETLNIKPAPSITDPSPVQVCSGIYEEIAVTSCAPEYTLSWSGNGTEGEGSTIPITLSSSDTTVTTVVYQVNTVWDECASDTLNLEVNVMPSPGAAFDIAPNPAMQNIPAFFVDQSAVSVGNISEWQWTLDGGQLQYGDINSYIIPDLGYHTVCLEVFSDAGCPDTLCKDFEVVTPTLTATNVFTPNGDDSNSTLVFDQLEFFPASRLYVYNRWGVLVFEKENYQNNWDGDDLPDGTYYYVLEVEYYGSIAGYVHILR